MWEELRGVQKGRNECSLDMLDQKSAMSILMEETSVLQLPRVEKQILKK